MISETWPPPPAELALDEEVHVWRVPLADPEPPSWRVASVLDEHEQERASRFRFPDDRRRYVHSHIGLREVLARYQGVAPGALRMERRCQRCGEPHGKPRLAPGQATLDQDQGVQPAPVEFNLSHSGDLALIAVARRGQLGVDLERLREDQDQAGLLDLTLSPAEREWVLRAASPAQGTSLFYRYWTLKEAYLKARGTGLLIPMSRLETVREDGPYVIVDDPSDPDGAGSWRVRPLAIDPGYVAAVAAEGRSWHVHCWTWPGPSAP